MHETHRLLSTPYGLRNLRGICSFLPKGREILRRSQREPMQCEIWMVASGTQLDCETPWFSPLLCDFIRTQRESLEAKVRLMFDSADNGDSI